MKSRLAVVVLLTGILVVLPSASGHVTGPDDCNAAAEPPMVGGNLDSVMASLRWESDAADLGNGIVCFDRYVRNRSQDRKLIFEWPPGHWNTSVSRENWQDTSTDTQIACAVLGVR